MADVLGVKAYELLKPETVLPDNAINVIEKYNAKSQNRIPPTGRANQTNMKGKAGEE
jgi:hypothetical protein